MLTAWRDWLLCDGVTVQDRLITVTGLEPEVLQWYVIRIQAAWRGYALRRMPRFASEIAACYVLRIGSTTWRGLTQRQKAKSRLFARNHRVKALRLALLHKDVSPTKDKEAVAIGEIMEELQRLHKNRHHRHAAIVFLQAYWRACRLRRLLVGRIGRAIALPSVKDVKENPTVGDCGQGSAREQSDAGARQHIHRICILFSDTGGGHRASASALEAGLKTLYGKHVVVSLVDFIRAATNWPWRKAPEGYQIVGQFPSVYKKLYESEVGHASWRQTRAFQMLWWSNKDPILEFLSNELKRGIDLMISVHPLVNHLVLEAFSEMRDWGYRFPSFAIVVTDLGSAHFSWFDSRADLLFAPSQRVEQLAMSYGFTRRKLCLCGLPVRQGFWNVEARSKLDLQVKLGLLQTQASKPEAVVLVMSGGEGFGDLLAVSSAIGDMMARLRLGQMVVICGRNAEAKEQLEHRDWCCIPQKEKSANRAAGSSMFWPRILGFVPNIDEYMGAADVLVTKAGPGSIAEAMIKGLPCLLTSFLPGQEEGNVSFVTDGGAGDFVPDSDPKLIATRLASWLRDPKRLSNMSQSARQLGRPQATLDIARNLGDGLLHLGPGVLQQSCVPMPAA